MRTIKKIISIRKKTDYRGSPYFITNALLDSGDEVEGWGKDFKRGDKVTAFFDDRWNKAKMVKRHPEPQPIDT